MAIRYAVATGNWSNTATWNGGTLPATTDDVRSNGFVVTVDSDRTAATVSNKSETSPSVAAGGYFGLANGVTLTATNGIIGGFNVTSPVSGGAVNFQLNTPNSATIVGAVSGGSASNMRGVLASGSGTLNLVGNVVGGSSTSAYGVNTTGAGTLNITGSVTGGSGSAAVGVLHNGTGTTNITGSCTGGSASNSHGVQQNNASGLLVVTGDAVGGAVGAGIASVATGSITHTGPCTASAGAPGLYGQIGAGAIRASGPFLAHSSGVVGISAPKWQWIASPIGTYMEVYINTLASKRNLYTADYTTALHMPAEDDVRNGTVYGPANELEGTLAVPPTASVAFGVPVDDTTGTAVINGASIDAIGALIAANFP